MIDASLLKRLKDDIESQVLPPGTVLVNFHSYIRSIPVLLRGHIKVIGEDDNGNEIVLYHLEPGDSCVMSILGIMNGTSSKIKAVTIEESEVLLIRPEKAAALIKESPAWSHFIFELYQARFEELLQVVSKVSFKNLDERIINFLREKSRLFKSKTLDMTHQEIANEIGSTREVVSRVLKKLEKTGAVELLRGKIRLL